MNDKNHLYYEQDKRDSKKNLKSKSLKPKNDNYYQKEDYENNKNKEINNDNLKSELEKNSTNDDNNEKKNGNSHFDNKNEEDINNNKCKKFNRIKAIGLKNFDYEEKYYGNKIKTGNICYMNSSIQCLFHLKDFTDNIAKSNIKNKKPLIKATYDLINDMEKYNEKNEKYNQRYKDVLSVEKIKNEMGKIDNRYYQNNQEDANEFISNFLEGLLDEIGDKNSLPENFLPERLNITNEKELESYNKFYNRFYKSKGNSFLLDLFYVIIKNQKVCKECGKFTIKFNAYNIIELPIYEFAKNNRNKELYFIEILQKYFEKNENIDGECVFCHSNNIYELTNLYKLSKYLIFYFGRTIDDKYINNNIIFPVRYDFGNILFEKKEIKYRITGIIYYSKMGIKCGHYTASCLCDDDWYFFDDTYVKKIQNDIYGNYGNPIILIYENINDLK